MGGSLMAIYPYFVGEDFQFFIERYLWKLINRFVMLSLNVVVIEIFESILYQSNSILPSQEQDFLEISPIFQPIDDDFGVSKDL